MPTGPGSADAQGIWQYGEADADALASDLINRAQSRTSAQFAADRVRLVALEPSPAGVFTPAVGYTANNLSLIRRGKLVVLRFQVAKTAGAIGNNETVGTIPAAFRPSGDVYFGGAIFGVGSPAAFKLSSAGVVSCLTGAAGGMTVAVGSGSWEAA